MTSEMTSENTMVELKNYCRENGIGGYSKLKKNELITKINKANSETHGGADEKSEESEKSEKSEESEEAVKNKSKYINHIGLHVFKEKDIVNSINNAINLYPLNAIQIFTHGPRNTAKNKLDNNKIMNILNKSNSNSIQLYVHSSYPTNPWNGKLDVFKHTLDQFQSSHELNALGVVLHIPKIEPVEVSATVKKIKASLVKMNIMNGQKIILEMKAVSQDDNKSYESPMKINRLIEELIKDGLTPADTGICIDTAHIYAGKADIRTYKKAKQYLVDLKYPEWICLLHINGNVYDSTIRAGDKHAIPLDADDMIWKNLAYEKTGCRAFIEFANSNSINYIVESKEHHTFEQINTFVKKIVKNKK
jgi:endonuclease IV